MPKVSSETFVVCGKCGRALRLHDALRDGWLVASARDARGAERGRMVIRCPLHVTRYALNRAGARYSLPALG